MSDGLQNFQLLLNEIDQKKVSFKAKLDIFFTLFLNQHFSENAAMYRNSNCSCVLHMESSKIAESFRPK